MIKGIDCSHWQGDIDWPIVPAEYKFCFIKATEGTGFTDGKFATNAAENGRLWGAYHFWRYYADPILQAEHFHSVAHNTVLPPVVDLEDTNAPKGDDTALRIRRTLNKVEELFGRKPIIYTARWWWDAWTLKDKSFGDYDLWVADYSTISRTIGKPYYMPAGWTDWQVWQKSSSGRVNGIQGNVDMNDAKEEWYNRYSGDKIIHKVALDVPANADIVEISLRRV